MIHYCLTTKSSDIIFKSLFLIRVKLKWFKQSDHTTLLNERISVAGNVCK